MNIMLVGSEQYRNLDKVEFWLELNIDPTRDGLILAKENGVEEYAAQWAKQRQAELDLHEPRVDKYTKVQHPPSKRNMMLRASKVVVFWDGLDPEVDHLLDLAIAERKDIEIIF